MENKTEYSFEDFERIIARLRAKDGCPWDQVQTHASLRDGMIEEAYEVVDGIDTYQATGDDSNLCEELGDVLMQVVMHARIAEEEGRFTMADVIRGISEKMIRRHPHVFGTAKADTPEEVLKNWEEIKQQEKHEDTITGGMKRVAKALPANIRAAKVQKKAAKVGFDFENYRQTAEKVEEELQEVLEAFPVEDEEILQVQVNRVKKLGNYHLPQAENPVWICSFTFREGETGSMNKVKKALLTEEENGNRENGEVQR